jgi:hypothetical protein
MIVSLKYRYIYIRPRKTGSSTIESILRGSLGPDDIVVHESFRTLLPVLKPGAELPPDKGLVTHTPASRIRPLIRDDIWDQFFKFTSERHPYEKALSFARHRLRGRTTHDRWKDNRPAGDFAAFLDEVVRGGKYSTFRYYAIDGRPVVDDFIRLESLGDDIRRILARIGAPAPEKIPHKRKSEIDDGRPAREILTQEQRDIVFEHCRAEFELLGYER